MTESFKQQLQELINQAAEKFDERNNQETDYYCPYSFKQGCEFIMPMIDSLVDIRNTYIEHLTSGPYHADDLRNRNDKALLQLLKGER